MGRDGLCKENVPLIDKEPHGYKHCNCPCVNFGLRGAWWQQGPQPAQAVQPPEHGLTAVTRLDYWIRAHIPGELQVPLRERINDLFVIRESRADLAPALPVADAAEICAEMAREADTKAARNKSSLSGDVSDVFALGAAAQFNAQADALRQAERRIRAATPPVPGEAACDGCAHPFATPSRYCFICYQSAREAGHLEAARDAKGQGKT
jgi:hypothetical protein